MKLKIFYVIEPVACNKSSLQLKKNTQTIKKNYQDNENGKPIQK